MKSMKKILATLAIALMFALPTQAQVFLMDEDNERANEPNPFIPANGGWSNDQGYLPLGSGATLLIGFGAAYMLAKRNKKQD